MLNMTTATAENNQTKLEALTLEFRGLCHDSTGLSILQFQKILQREGGFFSGRIFALIDTDGDGSISQEEFAQFFANILSKEDKIELLFRVYDLNGDGFLTRDEVKTVLLAMLEESKFPQMTADNVENLVKTFFGDCDQVNMENFKHLLNWSEALSTDISTIVDHWIGFCNDEVADPNTEKTKENLALGYIDYVAADPKFYIFLYVFYAVVIAMMVAAGIMYRNAKDSDGDINLYFITARITGFPLNFVCVMVFVFMQKDILNSLRSAGAGRFLPLDFNLYFHKVCGVIIMIFGALHSICHFINFGVNVVPDPEKYLKQNGLTADLAGYHPPGDGGQYTYFDWIFTPKPHL